MLIDSHCHPDDAKFAEDAAAVLERATAAGVDALVAIGGLEFARRYTGPLQMWATVGVHPHEAATATDATFEAMKADATDPRVIAIGEIGLDYHYDHSPRPVQIEVFRRQLQLAVECGLPVSIHCRDAWDDCFTALREIPAQGIFHCFTGAQAEAQIALDLGWYLSFSGMLTFPKAESLREVARAAPPECILVETDAPYLAPVPHRGKRNEPAFVRETLAKLAELRGWTLDQAASQTQENFFRLFPRAVLGHNKIQ